MGNLGEREEGAYARVQEARNPKRPYTIDLIKTLFTDFVEIHGDRRFADDPAMVCGFARLDGIEVAVIGQQKGRDMNQRRHRNFAMSKPEGYRKALRVMKLAEKFSRPVVTFVDTPGAYPGIDAEERGQAEAIAFNLREMAALRVPIIVVVLGEGGSGGALAIGVGDRVLMLENAVYSVITPEGCAAILWKDAAKAPDAAAGLRLTADNLKSLGIIDSVVQEDFGRGSWEMPDDGVAADDRVFANLSTIVADTLRELMRVGTKQLLKERYQKFRQMGRWIE